MWSQKGALFFERPEKKKKKTLVWDFKNMYEI